MDIKVLSTMIPKVVYDELPLTIGKFSINTPLRLSHFLSQAAHESVIFAAKVENLNYGSQGLLSVFPKYFTSTTAIAYQRQPEKIANKVYSSRMGNGDEASGDGWKFRGRGYIQLTGKSNYSEFDKVVDEDILTNPNLVADKYPLLSAAWFWNKNAINAIADLGDGVDVVTKVRKKINGGTIGLDDCVTKFNFYYSKLKTA